MKFIVRQEQEKDYRAVEEVTRRAFWNQHVPGCDEHYLAHTLRGHEDFLPQLDLVAVAENGTIVGNVMYTKARLVDDAGMEMPILSFGPISVEPDCQRQGIGKALLERSFEIARSMGYQVIVIFGNPENYVARGFKSCKRYNVCVRDGVFPAAMLVRELVPGILDGRRWFFHESPACYEIDSAKAEAFDATFPPMKKEFRPSQEEFFILSSSVIR